MGIGGEMQIDPGKHIFHILVDEGQPPRGGEACGPCQIAGIDSRGEEAHPRRLGQRPERALDLLARDIEMGFREGVDIAEMIEMGMGDEDRIHILGPQAAECEHPARIMPMLDAIGERQGLAVVSVVVADIHHGDMVLGAQHHIAIGHAPRWAAVAAVEDVAGGDPDLGGVFQHPEGIVSHRMV